MSSAQYRRLLTNLPSMASVVNTFQSPDVQLAVYRTLIESLLDATTDEAPPERTVRPRTSPRAGESGTDVVVGDSIHSIVAD